MRDQYTVLRCASPILLQQAQRAVLFLASLFLGTIAPAQTFFSVGSGTGSNTSQDYPSPFANYYWGQRAQYLYLASEMSAAGMAAGNITHIRFNVTALNSCPALQGYTVKMKHLASTSSLPTGNNMNNPEAAVALTTVFGPSTVTPVAGMNTIALATPFAWNGTQNLMIEICLNNGGFVNNGNASVQMSALAFNGSRNHAADNANNCTATGTGTNPANLLGVQTNRPNIAFGMPAAACGGAPNAGTVPATASACPGGTTTITASGASAGIGISYEWQEFNGSIWVPVVGGTGAATTSYTTPAISTPKQYRLRVLCSNSGLSATSGTCAVSAALSPACYCSGVLPTSPNDDGTGIRNVSFNTINNTSVGGPAYTSFTGVQTAVNAGAGYPLSVSVNTAGDFVVLTKAWFDWNRNATFEVSEEYDLGSASNGNPLLTSLSPLNITVPGTALGGATIMRVRTTWDGSGLPTPCGAQDYSEAEDYTINVTPCTPPTVQLSAVDNCANDQFSIAVNISAFGSTAQANIVYAVDNGAPISVTNAPLGTTNIGPFATSSVVSVTVNNGPPGCSTGPTLVYSGCPIQITCGSTLSIDHCYQNNDPRTFLFVSDNPFETVTVSFVSGTMGTNDLIRAFSGTGNSGPSIPSLTGNFPSLAGATGTSTGQELFIEIESNGSNSCATGEQSTWTFEAECTAGCIDPDAAVIVNTNCAAYNFTMDVEVLFTGDAATTTLRYTVNGGPPTDIPGLSETNVETIGPFAIDDVVNVRLLHESDGTCDRNLGNFTDNNTCPPYGTDCTSARPVTNYPYLHSSTTCGAGNQLGTQCSGSYGGGEDYVYKLTITNPGLYAINLTATGGGSFIGWFLKANGSCTTAASCLANATSGGGTTANGTYTFAAGTYYLIIDTWPTPNCSAYTLQITYELCPTPVAGAASGVGLTQAFANWTGTPGTYLVEWGPAASFTTPGTAATAGAGGTVIINASSPQLISGLLPGTQYRYFVRRNCGVDGWSANSLETTFTTNSITAVTQGACAQNKPIPDDGCSIGSALFAGFTVSGQPSTLGTNVGLSSVEIIITHSFRSDLIVSLISPSGQEVLLIDQRGGSFANFGANGTCPAAPFRLIASGSPLTSLPAANNAAGNWIPEQPLTGFNTGNPNGTWVLKICDNVGADTGQLRYVKLNFLPIDCLGVPGGAATPGTACNDNNACTITDVWSAGCVCAGTFQDTDGDGTCNANDGCPNDANKIAPGICGCGVADTDSDGDSTADCNDGCPNDPDKIAPGVCGCGIADTDSDGDSTADCNDGCPDDPDKTSPGVCGCGVADTPAIYYTDADNDGLGDPASPVSGFACVTPPGTVANSDDPCPAIMNGTPGDACDDGNPGTFNDVLGAGPGCACAGQACSLNLTLEFQLDGVSTENWEIRAQGTNTLVQAGSAFLPVAGSFSVSTCVPNGCFYLKVTDDGGDGITGGGYVLRSTSPGKRIIDNRNNFLSGAVSQIAGDQGWCVTSGAIGNDRLITASCDRLDLQRGATSACSEKLTADNTPNNTSGSVYQFWVYNPNGPESQLIPATGAGSNILSMNSVTLPAGKVYNVKVRTRISPGVYRDWGPACRMSISATPTPCRVTKLVDDVGSVNWSCGKTVILPAIGAGNGPPNMLVAKPATRLNTNCVEVGANKYQFRIKDIDTQISTVVNGVGSNYYCYMIAPTFQPCRQYEVDVRCSFDGGATWCAYSEVCTVFSGGCSIAGGNQNNLTGQGTFHLHPNPNRGDQVMLRLENLGAVATVSVDIYDAFGKRVIARTITVQDGFVNQPLELNGTLAAGLYVVNITAGETTHTERLVIEP